MAEEAQGHPNGHKLSLVQTAMIAILTGAGGGLTGSVATGTSVAAELREFKATILGKIDGVTQRQDEKNRALERLERLSDERAKELQDLRLKLQALELKLSGGPR
jgi:hypothetical protein